MADLGCSQTLVRAALQRRCAEAYLHDIRGSLQAVLGAVELLCRVAKSGADDAARAEKACGLARRAIGQHERTTLDMVQLLSQHPEDARVLDLRATAEELVHLFRNDIARRGLTLQISGTDRPSVLAERGELHAAVAALLTWAIDSSDGATRLGLQIEEDSGCAMLTLQTTTAGPEQRDPGEDLPLSEEHLIDAIRQFAAGHGGRIEWQPEESSSARTLRLSLPCVS